MAYIKYSRSDEIEHLRKRHTFGRRSHKVETSFELDVISKLHALIAWKASSWVICDLSRNGVWINNKRIKQDINIILKIGDVVQIAGEEGVEFTIENLDPPRDMVFRRDNRLDYIPIGRDDLIPNESAPDFGLYQCPATQDWHSEIFTSTDASRDLESYTQGPHVHGDQFECSGNTWQLFLSKDQDYDIVENNNLINIDEVHIHCDMNTETQNVSIVLSHNGMEMELAKKNHHQLICALLQEQINSAKISNDNSDWVDSGRLMNRLGINRANLLLQLFLIRRQITAALKGYSHYPNIIERQRHSLRFSLKNVSLSVNGKEYN